MRGKDLCADFIGQTSFTAYFLTLLNVPSNKKLVRLVDASLVAIAEHGLVPSVQAARMTRAAAPDALQAAVAAGLLDVARSFLALRKAPVNCSRRLLPTVAMQILARLPTLRSKLFAKSESLFPASAIPSTNP